MVNPHIRHNAVDHGVHRFTITHSPAIGVPVPNPNKYLENGVILGRSYGSDAEGGYFPPVADSLHDCTPVPNSKYV